MKVSTEIDNNFGHEQITQLVDNIPLKYTLTFFHTCTSRSRSLITVTEYGTALTTILPILFLYLNTVTVTAGTFEP